MSEIGSIVIEGVDYGARLPRGRHGIPKAAVAANQRERLLGAVSVAIRKHGYAALAVGDVTELAGVSRQTFYQLFDRKLDCVVAAHRAAVERLEGAIAQGGDEDRGPRRVATAVAVALEFAAAHPEDAYLILVAGNGISEPEFARLSTSLQERLSKALRDALGPPRSRLSEVTEQASLGAAMAVVSAKLLAGEPESLPNFRTELTRLVLAPYLGDRDAERVALSAPGSS